MSRFLHLLAALSTTFIPFLPKVAFGLPSVVIINTPTVILDPNSNFGTVVGYPTNGFPGGVVYPTNNYGPGITYPINRFPRGVVYPTNNYVPGIGYPSNRFPRGVVYPTNNYGPGVGYPTNVNPGSGQISCGSMVFGSPIPSPVPVNPYTGRVCR